jgi:hypothetical protein
MRLLVCGLFVFRSRKEPPAEQPTNGTARELTPQCSRADVSPNPRV